MIETRILRQPGSALGNLEELFKTLPRLSQEVGRCGCFIGNSLAEFGFTDPAVRRVLNGYLEKLESAFAEVLRRASDSGEISPSAPVENLAKLLVTTMQGLALLSKVQSERELMDRVLPTTMAMLKAM